MRLAEHLIGFFGFCPINPTHRDMRMRIGAEKPNPPRQFDRDRSVRLWPFCSGKQVCSSVCKTSSLLNSREASPTSSSWLLSIQIDCPNLQCFFRRTVKCTVIKHTGFVSFVAVSIEGQTPRFLVAKVAQAT